MRIYLSCMQCLKERNKPDDAIYLAELQDSGLYWMRCRAGHETVTCLQEQKFEILYELAANAILDGYYRDAVVSFTSSLERFYEFYIHVMCIKRGVLEERFLEAWDRVAVQSERQLGAYIFIYALENGQRPELLNNKMVTFRNEVIHRGKIPTKQEAIEYGQAVLGLIVPVLSDLKAKDSKYVSVAVHLHVKKTHKQIKGKPDVSFMSVPTIISISRAVTEPQPSLEDALIRLAKRRKR